MVAYLLIGIGSLIALAGIIFFIRGTGSETTNKVKFFGFEVESKSTALIILLTGAALIIFGAKNDVAKNTGTNTAETTTPAATDSATTVKDTTAQREKTIPSVHDNAQPLKAFTLTAGQQQVFNDMRATFTLLPNQNWNEQTKAVRIRIWREIQQPVSDTAYLDPSGNQPTVVSLLFITDHITPVILPDIGSFQCIVSNPVIIENKISTVSVKLYSN
ncbi:MAG TPA: hypothetical protein PKC39_13190 [Ferruginibacter sp.]|nr:hypothetical protein [Ferruginibacter sp.]HMP21908.1 hypothetical protein [Ferruginibacter sp.]